MPGHILNALRAGAQKFTHGDRLEDGSVWLEVFRSGVHMSPFVDGQVLADPRRAITDMVETLPMIIEQGWHGAGMGIPFRVDPDHSMGGWFGGNAEGLAAAGQVLELRADEDDAGELVMLARVAWTEMGRKALEVFRSCSVEFFTPGKLRHRSGPNKGEPIDQYVLTGIVLTNNPMVVNLQPVAASFDAPSYSERTMPLTPETLALLGLDADADADAVTRAVKKNIITATERSAQLEAVTAERDAFRDERDTLMASEIERAADRALGDGRIIEKQVARYKEIAVEHGIAFADETYCVEVVKTAPRTPDLRGGGDNGKPPEQTPEPAPTTAAEVEALIEKRADAMKASNPGMSPGIAYQKAQLGVFRTFPTSYALLEGADDIVRH